MNRNLIYAVGDIHGRLDLLERSAQVIQDHLADDAGRVIFLGDYVDRGPESRGVIEYLMEASAAPESAVTCLKGNHEDMLIEALRNPEDQQASWFWLDNGGDATVKSYSMGGVPEAHLVWMEGLPTAATDDHRVYVHAGVMPGVPISEQEPGVCMWIRERFLRAGPKDLPTHIVHGHTPKWAGKPDMSQPELLPHRTNLDTAAFTSGVLTIGVFDAAVPGGPIEVLRVTA